MEGFLALLFKYKLPFLEKLQSSTLKISPYAIY